MRKKFATLFIAISIFFGSLNIVFGDNFKKAIEAYHRADLQNAISYFKLTDEQGDALAQYNLGL